jgi:hypothetical protein
MPLGVTAVFLALTNLRNSLIQSEAGIGYWLIANPTPELVEVIQKLLKQIRLTQETKRISER